MPEDRTPADKRPSPSSLILAAAVSALVLVSVCPLWLPLLPTGGFWLARSLAVIGTTAALIAVYQRRGGKDSPVVLASPASTLPLLALVFYSLIPAIYVEWQGGPLTVPLGARAEDLHEPLGQYAIYAVASVAESWVLAFSSVGLLLLTAFDRLVPNHPDRDTRPWAAAWGLIVICAAGAAFQAGKMFLPSLALPEAAWLIDALPPLVMFGMAMLVQTSGNTSHWRRLELAAGLVGGVLALFPYHIKALALFLVTLLLIALLRLRGWARVAVIGALLISPTLGAAMVMLPRGTVPALTGKIVLRQAETVFCLDFALREAASGGGEWRAGPLYFAAGLIPRVFWPEKPTLSHGEAFGRFCGVNIPGHSASITILGEPALRGGPWGTVAMGLVLAGLAGLVTATWKRGGTVATATALALTPWLVDFDQHFTLYIANLAKGFLALLPLALLVHQVGRQPEHAALPESDTAS